MKRSSHRRRTALALRHASGWLGDGLWFWLGAGMVAYGIWDFFLSGNYPARG